jgi:predicted phage-related endonuclease
VALTPEQKAARQGKLTASSIGSLVSGDKERIMNLWREMVGDPGYVEPDFSDNWPVRLGEVTEGLNLDWYEKKHGVSLTRRGEVVIHPDHDWAAATLDGFDPVLLCPVETKHVGGWEKTETIIQRYFPQMTWQMECTKSNKCAISIIAGAAEPYVEYVNYDKDYADELMARANRFMNHVWMMTEPVIIEPAPIYVPHEQMRELNLTTNNAYAEAADDWLLNRGHAEKFAKSVEAIKGMVPADVRRIYGRGLQAKRAKNGSIRITPLD